MPGIHLCLCAAPESRLEDVLWLTSGRTVEDRVLAGLGSKLAGIPWERVVLGLERSRGGAPSRPALLLRTAPAVLRARAALASRGSEVLLGLGGFTCLPAVLAARLLGIPVALLEMNAVSGSATRWLSPWARTVLHAWQRSDAEPGHRFVGPPLAPEFDGRRIPPEEEAGARAELGFDPDRPLLLVLGGSQGASALNHIVRANAPALVAGGLQILHQTGPGKLGQGCDTFTGYRAAEYITPMHRALCAATAVLSRGGASTLAEIAAVGRPALVVPYPHHADRQQERNARELGEGVRILPEESLPGSLRAEVERLTSPASGPERERMGRALRASFRPDGARNVLAVLASLASPRTVPSRGALA